MMSNPDIAPNANPQPKVSVVIPVYGVEKFIERCARALFEQTLDNIEYLFIDDCTPDRSISILQEVLQQYPNRKEAVHILRMPKNSGQAAVRLFGNQHVSGEYFIHCDSDDWVSPNTYQLMYEKAKAEDADLVVCDSEISSGPDSHGRHRTQCRHTDKEEFILDLLYHRIDWAVWNKMYRSSLLSAPLIPPIGSMGEDLVMTHQLVCRCKTIAYCPQGCYFYFFNPDSISHVQDPERIARRAAQALDNMRIVEQFYRQDPLSPAREHGFTALHYSQKNGYLPIAQIPQYYKVWKETFPGVEWKVMLGPGFSLIRRIKCAITMSLLQLRRLAYAVSHFAAKQ